MKTVTVHVTKEQLSRVIAEAHRGDVVVLTDGERQMVLEPTISEIDLEKDSPELAVELLKAAKGPFTPYSRHDLEKVAEQVLRETNRE
jgi:hypothetical protein